MTAQPRQVIDPRPEFLHNGDQQIAWVPLADAATRGQAKQAALHEVTSCYSWTTLRCTKVWMEWDEDQFDHEAGERGCWMEVRKGTPGAHAYWRVEEMDKL